MVKGRGSASFKASVSVGEVAVSPEKGLIVWRKKSADMVLSGDFFLGGETWDMGHGLVWSGGCYKGVNGPYLIVKFQITHTDGLWAGETNWW